MQIVQGLADHCIDFGFYFDQHEKLLLREIVFHEFLALLHVLLSLSRMQGPDPSLPRLVLRVLFIMSNPDGWSDIFLLDKEWVCLVLAIKWWVSWTQRSSLSLNPLYVRRIISSRNVKDMRNWCKYADVYVVCQTMSNETFVLNPRVLCLLSTSMKQ